MAITDSWTTKDAQAAGLRAHTLKPDEVAARDWLVHRLYTEQALRYAAIATVLGLTRQRIHQMHMRHLQRTMDSRTIGADLRRYLKVLRTDEALDRLGIPRELARSVVGRR